MNISAWVLIRLWTVMPWVFRTQRRYKESQQEAWSEARAQYEGPLYGPINGSTFLPYKFISMTDGSPIFPGEWDNDPKVAEFFNSCNPKKVIEYRSAYRTYYDGVIEVLEPYLQVWYDKGLFTSTSGSIL